MPERFKHSPDEKEQSLEEELEGQYRQTVTALTETGLIHLLPEKNDVGVVVTDGKEVWECPTPKWELIKAEIEQRPELEEKIEQGFTVLQLTPLLTQQEFITILEAQLKKHKEEGKLFGSDGMPLELDTNQPVYLYDQFRNADLNGSMRYYPQKFDKNDPGGMTKAELIKQSLNSPFPGWEASLIESGEIPARGKGKTIKGRKQPEAGASSIDYLKLLQTNPTHRHETGKIPESWLAEFIMRLHIKNQVLGDWQGIGKAELLIGTYHPSSDFVPYGYWYRGSRQASVDADGPGYAYDDFGTRSAVRIGVQD